MSAPRRYLGLDIGNCTGWAICENGIITSSGVRDFGLKASHHRGKRGVAFYNFLLELGQVDGIYYEEVAFTPVRTGDGHALYNGLMMLVEMYSYGWDIPMNGVHPSTLKKEFAGHGQAEKKTMCQVAIDLGWKGGVPGTDRYHDECDAIALLFTQLPKIGIDVSF